MKKVLLSDFFRDEYLATINAHKKRIQKILNEYDLAIFMARKAICLFDAMRYNEEFQETNCRVVSSRALYYDSMEKYKGKKVAVIDDVVVRGRSINRIANLLIESGIEADYYVAACDVNFQKSFEEKTKLEKTYSFFSLTDIYHFSGLITQYIEASMRTFNVDSPIYMSNPFNMNIEKIIKNCGSINLSSGLQSKFGIESRTIYFNYFPSKDTDIRISNLLIDSIFKIRFYFNDERAIAVPFVLFPSCDIDTIEAIYKLIKDEKTEKLISNDNKKIYEENKFKTISYLLSEALFTKLCDTTGLPFIRDTQNDIIQFNQDLDEVISSKSKEILSKLLEEVRIENVSFSRFLMTNYVRNGYQFIAQKDSVKNVYGDNKGLRYNEHLSEEDYLEMKAFSFSDIFEWVKRNKDENILEENEKIYVSSIIDVFIDKGFIVPAILHVNEKVILRAYKMGEFSKLTREQIKSFLTMLYAYQKKVDRHMDKTEVEKLCVLFFKEGMRLHFFAEKSYFEDEDYCAGYSYYGPRMSSSKDLYRVPKDSSFITDLVDSGLIIKDLKYDDKQMKYNEKYYIENLQELNDNALFDFCVNFATDFSLLNDVFEKHPYIRPKNNKEKIENNWNQYVHTLDQYLTLLAVGLSEKDMILSLCAEIYMIPKLSEALSSFDLQSMKAPLSGVNSGLWKYKCYNDKALGKTLEYIRKMEPTATKFTERIGRNHSLNPEIKDFLDECGLFLFQSAFIINEIAEHTNNISNLTLSEYDGQDNNTNLNSRKIIFDVSYYYDKMKEERKRIEEQVSKMFAEKDEKEVIDYYARELKRRANIILDKCDLFIETNNANFEFVEMCLVVKSDEICLADKYSNIPSKCTLDEISDSNTVVFSIFSEEELDSVVSSVLFETPKNWNCEFLLLYLKNSEHGYSQVLDSAKGRRVEKNINNTFKLIHNLSDTKNRLFVFQKGNKLFDSFGKIKVNVMKSKEYDSNYKLSKYSVEGRFEMTFNNIEGNGKIENININVDNGSTAIIGNSGVGPINVKNISNDKIINEFEMAIQKIKESEELQEEYKNEIIEKIELARESIINHSEEGIKKSKLNFNMFKEYLYKNAPKLISVLADLAQIASFFEIIKQ